MAAYLNGKYYDDMNEYYYAARQNGPLTTDKELIAYARKATGGWYDAGWKRTFLTFWFSPLDNWKYDMTKEEYARLIEVQRIARASAKRMDGARLWYLDHTEYYADNSVEEVWIDRFGKEKRVTKVYPHGDGC